MADLGHGLTQIPGLAGSALQITPNVASQQSLVLQDAYVRGSDLVAHYQPSDGFPFRTEIYWRLEQNNELPRDAIQLTVIVSVETDLLDTCPELLLATRLEDTEVVAQSPSPAGYCRLVGVTGGATWLEALHPSDSAEATLSTTGSQGGSGGLEWTLFSRFLEKGVIRRARLSAILLPSNVSDEQLSNLYQGFCQQAVPLTV